MPATVKGFSTLSFSSLEQPLTVAFSSAIQRNSYEFVKDIVKEVKSRYFFPGDPSKLALVYTKKVRGRLAVASIEFRFKSVSLSQYPVKQYRVTKGRKILKVTRTAGRKFNKSLAPGKTEFDVVTEVAIKRGSGFKVIHGKLGYKGWLHTGRKRGQVGVTGLTNAFSSRIFERNQQDTWDYEGNRLPIHQLWGPSFTNLLELKEMQPVLENNKILNKIFADLQAGLKL